MSFPNAYNGVKKIFTAEVLGLIAASLSVIMAVMMIISDVSAGSGDQVTTAEVGCVLTVLLLLVVAAVIEIISWVMFIIGLNRASRDEDSFGRGFVFAILTVILTAAVPVLAMLNTAHGIADNITDIIIDVFRIFVYMHVIRGVGRLAQKLNYEKLVSMGQKLIVVMIGLIILHAVMNLIPIFKVNAESPVSFSDIFSLCAEIVTIVVYTICLIYLGRGMSMLEKE